MKMENSAGSPLRLGRLLLLLGSGIAMFDFCFWEQNEKPGLSVPVFFLFWAALVILSRMGKGFSLMARLLMLLMIGAAGAAIVETSFTNTLIFILLTLALAGEMQFPATANLWGRWQAQSVAMLRAPGRLSWLAVQLLRAGFSEDRGAAQSLFSSLLRIIPAILLALIFGWLLANGNSVFSQWTGTFFTAAWKQVLQYLDVGRIFFWILGALLLLPLLRPVRVGDWWWRWSHVLPRFSNEAAARAKTWPSILVLGILNILFFVANGADLIFLWSGHSLPAGVTYTQFVHEGTEALISTALLSALVLTMIFQQAIIVARRTELKVLAYLWIAQNLFLLMSVALRLKRYIEAYDMTVARLSLILFLGLVAAGYTLLTIKIQREKSLSWLLGGAAMAVVATFYLAQFLNLAGWSAEYNVTQWEKSRSQRNLDVAYLHGLGPVAWPALYRAHRDDPAITVIDENYRRRNPSGRFAAKTDLDREHWRSWSLRAGLNRWALQ